MNPLPQQKFLKHDFLLENLASETPIYIVTEGNEPPFFTRFFTWDSSKSAVSDISFYTCSIFAPCNLTLHFLQMHGNSFQKKLAVLTNKGKPLLDVKKL